MIYSKTVLEATDGRKGRLQQMLGLVCLGSLACSVLSCIGWVILETMR